MDEKRKVEWASENTISALESVGVVDREKGYFKCAPFHDLALFMVYSNGIQSHLEKTPASIDSILSVTDKLSGGGILVYSFINEVVDLLRFFMSNFPEYISEVDKGCDSIFARCLEGNMGRAEFDEKINTFAVGMTSRFIENMGYRFSSEDPAKMIAAGQVLADECESTSPLGYLKLTAIQCGMVINGAYNLYRASFNRITWPEYFEKTIWSGCLESGFAIQTMLNESKGSGKLLFVSTVDLMRMGVAAYQMDHHSNEFRAVISGVASKLNLGVQTAVAHFKQQDETPA